MAESVEIKEIVSQAAIQVATALMMAFKDADAGPNQPSWQAIEIHTERGMVDHCVRSPHSTEMVRQVC